MAFFDRFRKKTGAAALPKAEEKVSKDQEAVARHAAKVKEATDATPIQKATGSGELPFRLLKTPHVSEKAARHAEVGTYVFDVPVEAEKSAIAKAVEQLYKVDVVGVRTIRHEGKPVYRGRRAGRRASWKKALVTVKKGQVIDLYEGV